MTPLMNLRRELLVRLGHRLEPLGFKLRIRDQAYVRKVEWGLKVFHLAFVAHPGADFDVIGDIGVRYDSVETFFERISPGKPTYKFSCNLGAELGLIAGAPQMRWKVASESDVEPAVSGIYAAFAMIGASALDRISTAKGALELPTSGERRWLYMPLALKHAKTVVALACIADRRTDVVPLLRQGMSFYRGMRADEVDAFLSFVKRAECDPDSILRLFCGQ